MLKRALDTGFVVVDFAALLVAVPLATAGTAWLGHQGREVAVPMLAVADGLAVLLWAAAARFHRLYAAAETVGGADLSRPLWTFATVAVVLAPLAIIAGPRDVPAILVVLYFAFTLAMIIGARLGRRALVGAVSPERVARRVARQAAAGVAPVPAGGEERRPRAPAGAFAAVSARMDEVTYAPGEPNVLSMTKFLRDGVPAPAAAAGPHAPALADLGERLTLRRSVEDGGGVLLAVAGHLDALSSGQLRGAVDPLIEARCPQITLDFSELRLVDSTGVGLLVGVVKRARAYGGHVRVTGLREQPRSVFRLLKVDRLFETV